MPAIVVRIHGQAALFQQMIDLLGQHAVQHGKQRHADHHAREAHHAAEQQNGEHDPEARQSGGVAEDFRSEDIAVKLLQQQHKNDEIQRLHRTDDHDQNGTRNRTDERPEKRDNIGHTDDNRNQ